MLLFIKTATVMDVAKSCTYKREAKRRERWVIPKRGWWGTARNRKRTELQPRPPRDKRLLQLSCQVHMQKDSFSYWQHLQLKRNSVCWARKGKRKRQGSPCLRLSRGPSVRTKYTRQLHLFKGEFIMLCLQNILGCRSGKGLRDATRIQSTR